MNTKLSRRRKLGYALLLVLTFTAMSVIILSGTMNRTSTVALLNSRNNQYVVGTCAAEAATEKAVGLILADYQAGADNLVGSHLAAGLYQNTPPNGSEYSFWTNFVFCNPGNGSTGQTYVARTVAATSNLLTLGYDFDGLKGYVSTYRVISNVRQLGTRYAITNAVQQEVQTAAIPLFQFAIFYNSLLEFTTAATMSVRGPVHANNDIYVGSSSDLSFYSQVTDTGTLFKQSPWAGSSSFGGATNFYGGAPMNNYTTLSLPIGTNNTAAAVREVLYAPPSGESVGSAMGTNRYYNKADINIIVSNSTVTTWVKSSISDGSPNYIAWTNMTSFMSTNITFYDQRESKWVKTTQIDVRKFATWVAATGQVVSKLGANPTNSGLTVYVADWRTNQSTNFNALRLTNGLILPSGGLTFATPNPIYVLGNYNCPNATYLNTTNTQYSAPASLLGDAITILSGSWATNGYDNISSGSFGSRSAQSTTVNAAIVAGVVYSTGSAQNQFSGGVHNLTRLLEDWSSKKLTLNTSIVNLFNSVMATNRFIYPSTSGSYYNPPTRDFNFDVNFTDPTKQPPGTPMLRALIRTYWTTPPPNVTNYAGF